MTEKEIKAEIAEFESLLNDADVPADEKEMAREEIADLKAQLKKLESKPAKKKPAQKKATPKTTVKAAKDVDPDCDDLLDQYNKRKERSKKSAKKAAKTSEAQKVKKAVEKVADRVQRKYKAGELTVDQLQSIIFELEDDLKELRKLVKDIETGKKKVAESDKVTDYKISELKKKIASKRKGLSDPNAKIGSIGTTGSDAAILKGIEKLEKELDSLSSGNSGNKTYIVTYDFTKYKPKSASIKKQNEDFREEIKAKNVDAVKAILKDSHNLNPFYFKIVEKTGEEKPKSGVLDQTKQERKILEEKGYSKLSTGIYGDDTIDNAFQGTQGQQGVYKSDLKFGLAYIYEDEYSGVMQIDKELMDWLADAFSGFPLTVYTNAGVDLHTSKKGKYKNITFEKVSGVKEFGAGGETCGCGGKLRRLEHKGGGAVEEIDYFEEYEKLPKDVREVLDKYNWGEDADYPVLEKMRKEVNQLGWDFDYYLDGVPYDLKKMDKAQRGMWIQRATQRMKQKGTEGAFTAQAKRAGMKPIAFAKKVLANKDDYSLTTVRRAVFVKNANKELFKDGGAVGKLDPQQKKAVRGIVFDMDDPEADWKYIDAALKKKFRGNDYDNAVAYAKSMYKHGGKITKDNVFEYADSTETEEYDNLALTLEDFEAGEIERPDDFKSDQAYSKYLETLKAKAVDDLVKKLQSKSKKKKGGAVGTKKFKVGQRVTAKEPDTKQYTGKVVGYNKAGMVEIMPDGETDKMATVIFFEEDVKLAGKKGWGHDKKMRTGGATEKNWDGKINDRVTYRAGNSAGTWHIFEDGIYKRSVITEELKKMEKAKSRFKKDWDKIKL